jgi:hypothetical protein
MIDGAWAKVSNASPEHPNMRTACICGHCSRRRATMKQRLRDAWLSVAQASDNCRGGDLRLQLLVIARRSG